MIANYLEIVNLLFSNTFKERNNHAIGFMTNKNDLDVVTIVTKGGMVKLNDRYLKIITDLTIFKQSIKTSIMENIKLNNDISKGTIKTYFDSNSNQEVPISELIFKQNQSWTAYMGSKADSSFEY